MSYFAAVMTRAPVLVVAGPTASGKTALAVKLARHFGTELVSADSRQIYRELRIGVSRPTDNELQQVHHHFIATHSIHEPFTAGDFQREARLVVSDLINRFGCAVVCGGTGLYFRALLHGFDSMPDVAAQVREGVQRDYCENGLAWLQERVREVDPVYFEVVDKANPQRLMRALEVYRSSGLPLSTYHKKGNDHFPAEAISVGIDWPRAELYQRIDARVHQMVADGLIAEAEALFEYRQRPALQTVGYQELFAWMEGRLSKENAIALIGQNTRQYAKRQLTWLRRYGSVHWFAPDRQPEIIPFLEGKSS